MVALLVAGLGIGGLAQVRVETGLSSFLPASDDSVRRLTEYVRSFGGDPVVVLLRSEQPRQLLGRDLVERVAGLEGALSRTPDVAAVYGPATVLNSVADQAQGLLAELLGRRDGLRVYAENQARAAGRTPAEVAGAGTLAQAEFDQRYGELMVSNMRVGLPTLRNQRFIDKIIYNAAGEPKPQWRYVVPDEHSLAILVRPREDLAQAGTERLVAAIRSQVGAAGLPAEATVSGLPSIVAALGATVGKELPLLGGTAVLVIGLCLFLVPWTGRRRRLVPLGVTLLATGLTLAVLGWLGRPVSLGVIAFLPVLVGLGSYYPTYFARGARPRVVLVVAGGTAAGFGSLALSPLPFVRDLGLTVALGVGFAVGLGWLLLGRGARIASGAETSTEPCSAGPRSIEPPSAEPRSAEARSGPTLRARWAAVAAAAAVAMAGWAMLPGLALQTNVERLTEGLPALADAERAERVLGTSGELAVVLRGPNVLAPEAWSWLTEANQVVVSRYGDQATPVLSAPGLLSFLGPAPTGDQIKAGAALLPGYLTRAVMSFDGRLGLLSYGVRLHDVERLRTLTEQIRRDLPPVPPGYEAELSGLPIVAVRGYELVSGDRYLAGLAGLLVTGAVLLLGLRRRGDGTRAVAAAALATGVELFGLWLAGIPLNPVTVALGSLTAAVGCEFTVMMCEAVRRRDRDLRLAVVLAALTSGAGFAVLALSELAVMRQFGLLLAVSVLLSYLAARFVVWAWPPVAVAEGVERERALVEVG